MALGHVDHSNKRVYTRQAYRKKTSAYAFTIEESVRSFKGNNVE